MPNETQERHQRQPASERPSQPYTECSVILQSRFAQNVYKRSYTSVSGSVYVLGIVLRIIGTEEQAHEAEIIIDEMLNGCLEDMKSEVSRFEIVCSENGLDTELKYTNKDERVARVTSPRGRFFLDMIKLLDRLIELQDALWLGAFITDKQYSANCYMWQRRLVRLGNRIRNMTTSAVGQARKKGGDVAAKVEKAVGESGVDLETSDKNLEESELAPE